jgi:alkanesulfonate monooxygenase SsuD/methylene tetrahydromethanopterin reductase-like flavin-dependent oxidoreductase (luciferase family)
MQIGCQLLAQSWGYDPSVTDHQVYDEEMRLALRADELGYDLIGIVEHHFEDYSFCPDNFVYLANLAGRTKQAKLLTAAVIVPWNQPLRVAEKAALLDELSGGRVVLGLGRGLSRREYSQFGISMDDSRDLFDEATPMILDALETGVMKAHEGKHFKQPEAAIRPRPTKSFKDRLVQVAMSSDSVVEAAVNRAKIMQFTYKPLEVHRQEIDTYAAEYRRLHGEAPPVPFFTDLSVVDRDAGRAADNARKYIIGYLHSVMHHYEMMGEHYANTKGYADYGESAAAMREAGLENVAEMYLATQVHGTPQQVIDMVEQRRQIVGDFDMLTCFRFAGMPFDCAMRSLEVFASDCMPELRNLGMAATRAA